MGDDMTAAAITHGRVFRAINNSGRVWGDGMSPKVLWDVSALQRLVPRSTSRLRTTWGAPAPVSAILRAANWIRFSSYSATSPSRQPNATSDASRSSGLP